MQDFTNYSPNPQFEGSAAQSFAGSEAMFFQRVYAWMFAGLAATAIMAFILTSSMSWLTFVASNPSSLWVAAIVQLGLVFFLSFRIQHLSPSAAKGIFLAYSLITGVTFSVIGMVYHPAVIFKAFISTAGVYGAMAVYGMVTKRSLQAWGSFLFMGLVGLIIASLVNFFFRSSMADLVICVIGVLVFAGLTAYDHQKLRVIHATALQQADEFQVQRVVVMGALTLYLDFINLFLFLLRLFGNSRD